MVSEAQREYAARGGTQGPFPFPFDEGKEYSIAKHANTYGPADGYSYSSPVGSYPPNAFGMYDMHGNVYEWVEDCEHPNYVGAPYRRQRLAGTQLRSRAHSRQRLGRSPGVLPLRKPQQPVPAGARGLDGLSHRTRALSLSGSTLIALREQARSHI